MTEVTGAWVRHGIEATTALRQAITRAKAGEPLRPVTVVVESNQVGVSARRQLASGVVGPVSGAGPGLIAVSFLTPYRLADLLGSARLAAQGRRPVSTPVLTAAVRGVLTTDAGVFAPVASHPATEAALVSSYRELRDLDRPALEAVAASSTRASEVVRVCSAARARLAGDWYDEEDLMAAATDAAADASALADVGALIVHLPQRLSLHAARLVAGVGSASGLVVLAGSTGAPGADAEVARSAALLGAGIGPPPLVPDPPPTVSTATTHLVTASDADDEARAAVRTVVDAVRAGTPLDRIAVLHAATQPYARLLHDHLGAAGLGVNGAADVALAGRLASRTLLGLLALPATGWRRQDVFAWLTSAPVLHQGQWAPTTSWERASRAAGVVAGRHDWDRRLAHFADALEAEADELEAGDDQPGWRAERARAEAGRARALRAFVLAILDRLASAEGTHPWKARVRWCKGLLHDLLGGPSRRDHWPEDERRAAERLLVALDRLAVLDDVEGPIDLAVFTRTLTVELEADLGRTGRFGEGVLVGPVSMGVGVDLDLVVLVGMAEGTFPSTSHDDSLLPDEDRNAAGGGLALRRAQAERLHHQFLATLGGSARQVLCIPKGDLRRSRERVPSRWALEVASSLEGRQLWSKDLLGIERPWLSHLASFDAGLRKLSSPATAQEHRLRHLLAEAPARRDLHAVARSIDDTFAAGVAVLDARAQPVLTRFDGNLAGHVIPSPIQRGSSATRLEAWAKCPHGYLMQQLLRVEPLEQPEDALQVSALDRGNLVHRALERFVLECLADGEVPEPDQPWPAARHRRLEEIAGELCDELEAGGLAGRDIFWQRDRRKILADLDRFLVEDDAHRSATGAHPIAAELAFGIGDAPAVLFPLGDGRVVPMRGKADRVDADASGTLHVLDYKTGSATPYKGIGPDDPHQGGRRLQLAVYGLAARQHVGTPEAPVRADYWFTSAKGRFDKHGYAVTAEVMASVGHAMRTIVDGIEAGLFPPHPKPRGTSPFVECHYCDPDGLGTTDLVRRWQHKLGDPVMAAYVALIAPEGDDAEDSP